MGIRESALSVISEIAQGDFVRAVTSDGNSRRVTVANLAKAIVESYTGSSLGGSQRSVKAAIDSLNSKIKTKTVTGTTTVSGAINMGLSIDSVKVLDIRIKNPTVGYVFQRGDGYATVFTVTNNAMTILPNTSVTLDIFYVEI